MVWRAEFGQYYRLAFISYVFLFMGVTPVSGNTVDDAAADLVRVMQADRLMLLAHQFSLTRDSGGNEVVLKTEEDKRFLKCISSVETRIFTRILAEGITEAMDAGEIRRAIHFFGTPLGKKIVALDFMRLREDFSISSIDEEGSNAKFSPEESRRYDEFKHSSEGKKLLVETSIFSQRIIDLVALRFEELEASCARDAKESSPTR